MPSTRPTSRLSNNHPQGTSASTNAATNPSRATNSPPNIGATQPSTSATVNQLPLECLGMKIHQVLEEQKIIAAEHDSLVSKCNDFMEFMRSAEAKLKANNIASDLDFKFELLEEKYNKLQADLIAATSSGALLGHPNDPSSAPRPSTNAHCKTVTLHSNLTNEELTFHATPLNMYIMAECMAVKIQKKQITSMLNHFKELEKLEATVSTHGQLLNDLHDRVYSIGKWVKRMLVPTVSRLWSFWQPQQEEGTFENLCRRLEAGSDFSTKLWDTGLVEDEEEFFAPMPMPAHEHPDVSTTAQQAANAANESEQEASVQDSDEAHGGVILHESEAINGVENV
ncbi:hypothetical protein M409DRAFT_52533 [Zasmidium cellare ATCC 36951]|uniref:Uncharacterized protein n=1 Tax=Zasmidium cellare ATCC 36951 TaxID=1080233 RepID=A0A6A6CSY6_ZASCE|nr:uncharacterized protein M409DRAFT_52533 [Zasmidium cellare ATCC 36951]KAF2169270.1 hypothetical protein M409DRAFT_52533 [Zasmidium cellare ATCC 36951]